MAYLRNINIKFVMFRFLNVWIFVTQLLRVRPDRTTDGLFFKEGPF